MDPRREWFETDYYALLGVSPDASDKDITKAYRKLARKHHPDSSDGDEERFKQISAAYDVIGDSSKRAAYDEARRMGPAGFGPQMGGFASGPGGFSIRIEDLGDLGGIFGHLFGDGRGRTGRGGPMPMRGQDLETRVGVSFRDAVEGAITEVAVPDSSSGGMRKVKVRIPAGVDDGDRIRLAGNGSPGSGGGPNGDLFVIVDVAPDADFDRDGRNLTVSVPITFPEAVFGADVRVLDFSGDSVTLRIPPGTPSGKTFRVRGRGVKTRRGTGDLLVSVEIAVPTKLSGAEQAAVEALRDVTDFEGASGRRQRNADPAPATLADGEPSANRSNSHVASGDSNAAGTTDTNSDTAGVTP
ncbi:DnaJ C-terminal domain-containing protein [Candidatus Poriferisodalis sp.]|uniref:DnaJ C-terminal domain-containing protein n=1 Tax=Candidatus Poriferisodalis sp. TaxID=3101277 RepID=UPI003B5C8437